MAVLDTVSLIECVMTPMAAPPHALDRLAQIYATVADTPTQAGHRAIAVPRLLMVRVPNGQITAARHALARMADVPMTHKGAARWEIKLHLSGFPDSASARRAARVLATQGAPTDYFWVGALAITKVAGPMSSRCGELSSDRPRASRRAVRRRGPTLPHTPRPWGPTRGSSEAIAAGWRNSNRRWPGFQRSARTSNSRRSISATRSASCCSTTAGTGEAERYFGSFTPYDYFYTSQAELYLGRIAEARGRPEEAVMHYGRVVRWWRYADEPLRPLREEARQALSRLVSE